MARVQEVPNGVATAAGGPVVGSANGGGAEAPPQAAAGDQLYVGELDPNVTDSQLYDIFSQLGPVMSVRVCRDVNTRRSLGYAYVNYSNTFDAVRAVQMLNFTLVNNRYIRVIMVDGTN